VACRFFVLDCTEFDNPERLRGQRGVNHVGYHVSVLMPLLQDRSRLEAYFRTLREALKAANRDPEQQMNVVNVCGKGRHRSVALSYITQQLLLETHAGVTLEHLSQKQWDRRPRTCMCCQDCEKSLVNPDVQVGMAAMRRYWLQLWGG